MFIARHRIAGDEQCKITCIRSTAICHVSEVSDNRRGILSRLEIKAAGHAGQLATSRQLEPPSCSLPCRASLSGLRKVLDAAWAAVAEAQVAERRQVGQGGRPARSHDSRVAADVQTPTAPTVNVHHQAALQEGTLYGTVYTLRCHDCNMNVRHARQ